MVHATLSLFGLYLHQDLFDQVPFCSKRSLLLRISILNNDRKLKIDNPNAIPFFVHQNVLRPDIEMPNSQGMNSIKCFQDLPLPWRGEIRS